MEIQPLPADGRFSKSLGHLVKKLLELSERLKT